jgi:hypothetical protein
MSGVTRFERALSNVYTEPSVLGGVVGNFGCRRPPRVSFSFFLCCCCCCCDGLAVLMAGTVLPAGPSRYWCKKKVLTQLGSRRRLFVKLLEYVVLKTSLLTTWEEDTHNPFSLFIRFDFTTLRDVCVQYATRPLFNQTNESRLMIETTICNPPLLKEGTNQGESI